MKGLLVLAGIAYLLYEYGNNPITNVQDTTKVKGYLRPFNDNPLIPHGTGGVKSGTLAQTQSDANGGSLWAGFPDTTIRQTK